MLNSASMTNQTKQEILAYEKQSSDQFFPEIYSSQKALYIYQ